MRDRAVVALEEVLARDLPVRLELELRAEPELERADVEDLRKAPRNVAESLGERRGVGVGIDEHERAPGVDLGRAQAELVELEAGLAVRARRRAQRPVQRVRPGVVRALEGLASPLAGGDDVAAVPADVHEGPKHAVSRACNYYGNLAGDRGEVGAVFGHLSRMADVLPAAGKDPLALAAKDLGVGVPP